MALAGSNGGSWSTAAYRPKSAAPAAGESPIPGGDNEAGMASDFASSREFRRRLSVTGTSSHGFGSGDQMSVPLASGDLLILRNKILRFLFVSTLCSGLFDHMT
ncbi:TIFY domain protein 8 [Actinidia rufa]|uniref:TIFY domain protein 8 n=1 Tax=Actinidia rufa TaxID=165716 RepID=A0A7J0EQT7_9ERIC|nr:TIFY domain protein 8 [Actinidia rufa]